ncbi:hypothetical protein ACGFNY_44450 [Streptomyces chartreusis]|uniref:hypothetical protein n=1 Tax=Streptomyces chartreusis TaxID=1969 RepID=UPI0037168E0C
MKNDAEWGDRQDDWERYEAEVLRRVAEVYPEMDSVQVEEFQELSTAGDTWQVVTTTLLLAPFASAIMTRAGNSVTDLTSAAARKVVGRMLEGRQRALEDALGPAPGGLPRVFVERIRVEGTDTVFVLPNERRSGTKERAAAALAMLDVDLSALKPRNLDPDSLYAPDSCNIIWDRGAWTVLFRRSDSGLGLDSAHWSQKQRAWVLSSGEVCSEVPPPPD